MRKVKFKKYNQAVYDIPLGIKLEVGQLRKLIEHPGWDKDFIHEGVFHQWGAGHEDFGEKGVGNYTIALVEDENGFINEVLPSHIQFISN